jgi:hypothetical protein
MTFLSFIFMSVDSQIKEIIKMLVEVGMVGVTVNAATRHILWHFTAEEVEVDQIFAQAQM